jgi:hypothetical protein
MIGNTDKERIRKLTMIAGQMLKDETLQELITPYGEKQDMNTEEHIIFVLGDTKLSSFMNAVNSQDADDVSVVTLTDDDTKIQSVRFTKIADDDGGLLPKINPMSSVENLIDDMGQMKYVSYGNQGYIISYNSGMKYHDTDEDD